MDERILLKPEIDRFTALAWKFQAQRKKASSRKIQAKMHAEIASILTELEILSDRLESGCKLMGAASETKRKKTANRNKSHSKRTTNRKDIFSIHNYEQPKKQSSL